MLKVFLISHFRCVRGSRIYGKNFGTYSKYHMYYIKGENGQTFTVNNNIAKKIRRQTESKQKERRNSEMEEKKK